MQDIIEYKQKDLILNVSHNPLVLDIDLWDDYLDYLCKDRYYQKNAIKNAIKFLAGGVYVNLNDLAKENYKNNKNIRNVYLKEEEYLNNFNLFGDKLFSNIDLATGTGKSYVMFAISHIMLCLGVIDKVLILCPSLTIEDGLLEKFTHLVSDPTLFNLIPNIYRKINPTIIDANSTIINDCICIENIHAAYENTGSSIKDSFTKNGGKKTLVLNDESHHIFNKTPDTDNKKWAEFLLNTDYNFKYILGFTGTAYQGNNYFIDVIYRYSIRQAIEDGFVKNIEYIEKDSEKLSENEKFQIIQQEHENIKLKYLNTLKPLTILITKDLSFAESLKQKLISFFYENEKTKDSNEEELKKEISKKILKITHKSTNQEKQQLKHVDDIESPIEYIIGVSMLNEGWDVKNVFQIIPMEDKAFNSKLLIAQVLGRGLRIPLSLNNAKVTVLNHHAWGKNIKHLVDEVLELETKITIAPIKNSSLHFTLHNIKPDREEVEVEKTVQIIEEKVFDYSKSLNEGITLLSQEIEKNHKETFQDIKNNEIVKTYKIKSIIWSIDEIVDKIYNELSFKEWEGVILKINDNFYSKKNLPNKDIIKKIILKSMEKRNITDNVLTEKNANLIFSAFSTLLRKSNNKIDYKIKYEKPLELNTEQVNIENIGVSNFRKNEFCFFYTDEFMNLISNDSQEIILNEFINGGFPYAKKNINKYLFKSVTNFVFSSSIPEKKFIDCLLEKENANVIYSWLKSKNKGFYSINYSIKKGGENSRNREYKMQSFNPDFFIKILKNNIDLILVVETKADKDDCLENKAKYKYAKLHFEELNKKLEENGINTRYVFSILSPEAYSTYFNHLKKAINGEYDISKYKCELELLLEE